MSHLLEEDARYVAASPPRSRPQLAVAGPIPDRTDHDTGESRRRREAVRTLGLCELLERRPELAGVHPPADLAAEALRWSL